MFIIHFLLKSFYHSIFISSVFSLTFHVFSDQILKYGPDALLTTLYSINKNLKIKADENQKNKDHYISESSTTSDKLKMIFSVSQEIARNLATNNNDSLKIKSTHSSNAIPQKINTFNNRILEQKKILDDINNSSP
jgi:hypothetical protein